MNTIKQLFLFVEQLDQLEVCIPYSRLLAGTQILAVFQNLRWNSNKTSLYVGNCLKSYQVVLYVVQGHNKVRRDTSIVFLINNVRFIYLDPKCSQPLTWFSTSINQENRFQKYHSLLYGIDVVQCFKHSSSNKNIV